MSRRVSESLTPLKQAISISSRRRIASRPSSLSKSMGGSFSLTAAHVASKALSKISRSSGSNSRRSDLSKTLTSTANCASIFEAFASNNTMTVSRLTLRREFARTHLLLRCMADSCCRRINPFSYRFCVVALGVLPQSENRNRRADVRFGSSADRPQGQKARKSSVIGARASRLVTRNLDNQAPRKTSCTAKVVLSFSD
jgi:hypothetical protein